VNKTLLVSLREFGQRARKRGFLLTSIGIPLLLMVIWAFTGVFGSSRTQPLEDLTQVNRPDSVIGYVDQAGLIRSVPDPVPADLFKAFPDIDVAEAALEGGDIGAYYVISSDYRQTGSVQRISQQMPTAPPDQQLFDWVLIASLFPSASPEHIGRLRWPFNASGPEFVPLSAVGEIGGAEGNTMLPFLVTIAVMTPLFTSGNLLLQSLTQENGSRIMEILLVSLRPRQLLTGKLLGLGALTLVQYVIWAAIGLLVLVVTGGDGSQLLSTISLSANELLLVVPYALGGFALYARIMAGIGALSPDMESGRAWVFIMSLPMAVPMFLWQPIASSPNGALATVLSLIPFSAPVAMLMRMTSTTVAAWQVGASLILLLITGIGMTWLMARLFRVQTLLSGESFSLRRMWSALRD
jgi:ABC-2 type transport system permease protein